MWDAVNRRLSIQQKLIGLIAALTTFVVAALTIYFSRAQIRELTEALARRAEIYGELFADQLAPAIAFEDRATAREVFGSLTSDADVTGAVICTSSGRPLHSVGRLPASVCRDNLAVRQRQILPYDGGVLVAAPVVSPEGPRGVLAIELSTARLRASSRAVTLRSLGVGLSVLLAAMLAAWFIARSITGRLRRIATVAASVTAGEIEQEPLVDRSADELGTLARGFNSMLAQLRALIANVQEMAKREQQTLTDANALLEQRVRDRTQELSAANEQLKSEMDQRSRMEIELRQAQKLESVGRLAAGVAHEINTPIQFVSDSVHFVRDAMTDLIPVIQRLRTVRQLVSAGSLPEASTEAQAAEAAEETADVSYLFEHVTPAVDRAIEGVQRVAIIVRSMKEFAHQDQAEMTYVDLNRAIESTLTICAHEYRQVADVDRRLGDVPKVLCRASEVNQAILNIVVNAAHAIGDKVAGSGARGRITIATRRDGEQVEIAIEDTGGGIPPDIRHRVFDPFFTTKEVGKGTGQGLAIARSAIVDHHGGALTFDSVVGQGTTFYIRLPVDRSGRAMEGTGSLAPSVAASAWS